jgi:tripartite-type tricarboxylate transporter receptor subunit TctC
LSTEISRMMTTPAMRDRAAQEGATPVGNKPAEFERFLRSEIAKWTPIIQKTGIKVD